MALCIYSINILPSKKTENSSRCLIFYLASILTFFLKNNLAFYLAFYLTFKSGILFFLARRWGLWVPTDIWRSQLRSSSAAVPTEIWSSRLKSGHATVIWCLQLRSWGKRVGEEGEEKGGEGRDAPLIKSRDPHGRLESPIAWNFIVIPPLSHRLLTTPISQCSWNSPRGHRRHAATGSTFGSIHILSIIVFSCKAPCQASFRPIP